MILAQLACLGASTGRATAAVDDVDDNEVGAGVCDDVTATGDDVSTIVAEEALLEEESALFDDLEGGLLILLIPVLAFD